MQIKSEFLQLLLKKQVNRLHSYTVKNLINKMLEGQKYLS